MDFSGKIAIITGGASGMGAATVREFVAAGGTAVIVDRNATLAKTVAQETGASMQIGDISDSVFCQQVVDQTVGENGRLDVLVNAAGIIVRADGLSTSDEQWQRVMNVNVNGTFFMCRAALKQMKAQQSGAIVNFGSIWGGVGAAGVLAYCTSKGAVHNMTKAMALEHATDNIRINAVCPGEVNTPMLQSERAEPVTQALLDRLAQTVPTQRLADPVEIARVVLFLASDSASYMTGSLVDVDAGFTAR
jgi:NAD(P)-dependent dehydrogenase (short-subunit alcohol dehydrogenase family)